MQDLKNVELMKEVVPPFQKKVQEKSRKQLASGSAAKRNKNVRSAQILTSLIKI